MLVPIKIARALAKIAKDYGCIATDEKTIMVVCPKRGILASYTDPQGEQDRWRELKEENTWQAWAKSKDDWNIKIAGDKIRNGQCSAPCRDFEGAPDYLASVAAEDWTYGVKRKVFTDAVKAIFKITLDTLPVVLEGGEFLATDKRTATKCPAGLIRRGVQPLASVEFDPEGIERIALAIAALDRTPASFALSTTEAGATFSSCGERGDFLTVYLPAWRHGNTVSRSAIENAVNGEGIEIAMPRWYLDVAKLFSCVAIYSNGEIFCYSPGKYDAGIACTGPLPPGLPAWIGPPKELRKLCGKQKTEFLNLRASGPEVAKEEKDSKGEVTRREIVASHSVLSLGETAIGAAPSYLPTDQIAIYQRGITLSRATG